MQLIKNSAKARSASRYFLFLYWCLWWFFLVVFMGGREGVDLTYQRNSVMHSETIFASLQFPYETYKERDKSGNPTSLWSWKPLCRLQFIPFLHFLWKLIRHATWNIDKCIVITHFDKYLHLQGDVWITFAPSWRWLIFNCPYPLPPLSQV